MATRGRTGGPSEPEPARLGARAALMGAIESFIAERSVFESSVPAEDALEAVRGAAGLQEAFAAPLKAQIFGLKEALGWALFLALAPGRAEAAGDPPLGEGEALDLDEAFALVEEVYDLGVAQLVDAHFDDDDDSEESGGEESGGEGAPASSGK